MALILFDLDGTLIDSEPGITASLGYAFAKVGAELPPREVLRSWIGPPFWQTFPSVLGDDHARIEAAIDHYRARFEDIGWSEHAVYPGIAELIPALADAGSALAIVTTKPQPQAQKIIDNLPFGHVFARVYGPDIKGRHCAKAEMIAQALVDFDARAEQAAMIGDRHFDMEGARANDVRALGVGWGFGSEEELLGAGAEAIAMDASELHELLRTHRKSIPSRQALHRWGRG
ncbi:HAD hydrolase-like protein [Dokdonella soli]|uniref:HAD family hydrolase n=1 Tax=Dokdonella soli TaxID=529810 RepID=A0ABP3TU90_9GAMM